MVVAAPGGIELNSLQYTADKRIGGYHSGYQGIILSIIIKDDKRNSTDHTIFLIHHYVQVEQINVVTHDKIVLQQ